jgi:hypothetical protein
MKLLTSLCGVIAALTIVCMASGQDKGEANKDLGNMQGSWRVVSSQVADEKAAEDEVKKRKVTVKGDTLSEKGAQGPGGTRTCASVGSMHKFVPFNPFAFARFLVGIFQFLCDVLEAVFERVERRSGFLETPCILE